MLHREDRSLSRSLICAVGLIAALSGTLVQPASAGFLSFVEARFDDVDGFDGLAGARGVAVSPDGNHVYVASQGENALVVLARDDTTGSLTFVEAEFDGVDSVDGLAGAQSVAVSPDGAHVYVVSEGDNAIAAFERTSSTGEVLFVEAEFDGSGGVDGLDGARYLALSSDGANVYVASRIDNAVAVFSRDSGTGELTYDESHFDDLGGVDGLDSASGVAVSPDGAHVYAVGQADNAIAAFTRDQLTGALTFDGALYDGVDSVEGLGTVRGVVVSPDGSHVYTSSQGDNAVTVFSRDGGTGALTFVEVQADGSGDVDGLAGAREVAVSATGAYVVATGTGEDEIPLFARDQSAGSLTFDHVVADGAGGVDGLNGVRGIAISPDGLHVYAVSQNENAIAVFRLVPCVAEPAVGCRSAEKTKLVIKVDNDAQSLRDVLRWRWDKGEETLADAFGDPVDGTSNYHLCLYDEPGGVSTFVVSVVLPFGGTCGDDPCWEFTGPVEDPRKIKYRDDEGSPDGVHRLRGRVAAAGRANVKLDGEGPNLKLEDGLTPTLPLFPPVSAQLFNTNGECWDSIFELGDIKVNDGPVEGKQRFKASARTN